MQGYGYASETLDRRDCCMKPVRIPPYYGTTFFTRRCSSVITRFLSR